MYPFSSSSGRDGNGPIKPSATVVGPASLQGSGISAHVSPKSANAGKSNTNQSPKSSASSRGAPPRADENKIQDLVEVVENRVVVTQAEDSLEPVIIKVDETHIKDTWEIFEPKIDENQVEDTLEVVENQVSTAEVAIGDPHNLKSLKESVSLLVCAAENVVQAQVMLPFGSIASEPDSLVTGSDLVNLFTESESFAVVSRGAKEGNSIKGNIPKNVKAKGGRLSVVKLPDDVQTKTGEKGLKTHNAISVSGDSSNVSSQDHRVSSRRQSKKSGAASSQTQIALFWNGEIVEVNIIEQSSQFVHCTVYNKHENLISYVTAVYASNLFYDRFKLWDSLKRFSLNSQNVSWMVGGDFNEVGISINKSHGPSGFGSPNKLQESTASLEPADLTSLMGSTEERDLHATSDMQKRK
ncbi:hypothetical protein QJS10_CPA10g01261 [Acorus calamus]|uniref:Uncharacterized protein n=1 Tax=Acorus calamus TaxID=4465 RepID=A0AAV9E2A1_ACOCL|nr:hypothetical protein QJS10_CPA10g01261 [Acorus calamus]